MLSIVRTSSTQSGAADTATIKKNASNMGALKRRRHSISTTTLRAMGSATHAAMTMSTKSSPASPMLQRLPLAPRVASTPSPSAPTTSASATATQAVAHKMASELRRHSFLAAHVGGRASTHTQNSATPVRSPVKVLSTATATPMMLQQPTILEHARARSKLTTPDHARSSSAATTTQPLELPILRHRYVARNVRVVVGPRWRLQRYEVRSVQLETGATPMLSVFANNAMTETPEHALELPMDSTCVLQNGNGLKIKSRQDSRFRVRIRFLTAADAAIWSRVIEDALAHAAWLRGTREVACLSRDRHSSVVLVKDDATKDEHVVKILKRVRVDDGTCEEVIILKKLVPVAYASKPLHFLTSYRVVETASDVRIVMPRYPGKTLLQFLSDRPRPQVLGDVEARMVTWKLCEALQALHACGVVHCDVKLENVLLTDVSDVRLIDFGGAFDASRSSAAPWPRRKTMIGTPGYIAPERVLRVDEPPTSAVDLFSLGILLYQMLVGQHPFACAGRRRLTIDDSLSLDWTHMEHRLQSHFVPKEAQQLVQRLVDANPHTRIRLDQVFHHPWFTKVDI